ncbi:ISH3 family transposase [Halobacterium noricense]|nr:ISH3 family transposase [Halobacterium noricense]UHH24011.1 ISH3 family transposase [Halobacterium noricense]UHH26895.1 ISH3 family transposase [Halobacterium noricense]UHH27113.1 ISH3 family transposase [Halobacterium noricense]UHH27161.1 ISH3 family transposase [Halobacterium noricense]UHH27206.1 ISH3 family transposase [Halobacterium noricense]
MYSNKQADGEIHEDQLLNFLVNRLDEEVPISLANNAEIAAEDIYEVLVGACADGTSVSTLCASSQNTPTANTILYHLRTKFEPERLERVANTLLRKDIDELLPKQVEVCADLHLRPYYGDKADTDGLYHSVAKRGTTAFHAYATLYARVTNKRYTLAVRRLEDGDTASSVLAEFLGILDGLDTEIKAVYLDRGFYDSKCLTLLQTHDYAYVIPIIRWGETIQQELSEGWSRVIQHDLTGKLDGHSWTVEFPVYIDCTYLNGKYDENGVARHGYAADAPFIDSPRDARYHYTKRFGIESSYRLFEQAIATTTTRDPTVRLLYVVVSLLLQNVWRYLHYEYVATPRRGGRRLWWWPYKEFVNMVRRAAWTALAVRRAVPANRPPDDRFHR